ncbi:MAG: HAD hydrolase family protein [Nanoarchaeota archaeon]|nr:HAD hydrolase family protein [Nanoarchaeota archaeon]
MRPEYKIAIHIFLKNLLDESSEFNFDDKTQLERINNLLRAMYNLESINKDLKYIKQIIYKLETTKKSFLGDKKLQIFISRQNSKKYFMIINDEIKEFVNYLENKKVPNIRIVFSDIDNTLIHKSFISKFLPIINEDRIVSKRAISLLAQIGMKGIPVVLISGRRMTSFYRIMNVIPHSFAILEHGCLILRNRSIDTTYASYFSKYIGNPLKPGTSGLLWEYEKEMRNRGLKTDSKDRVASFRIDPNKNNLSASEQQKLLSTVSPIGK